LKEGIVVRERELKKIEGDSYRSPTHYVILLDTSFSSSEDYANFKRV